MANIIKPKRSNTTSSVPTTSNLSDGELAVNSADKKIFLRVGSDIVEIANKTDTTDFKILDDISSSFNGSTTQFTISSASTNFLNSEVTSAARLLISVGGTIQEPDPNQGAGFYLSGGTNLTTDPVKINFVEAPKSGQPFFGIAFGKVETPATSYQTPEQSLINSIVFGV